MNPPDDTAAAVAMPQLQRAVTCSLAVPAYLERVYWWAYVHPRAVRVFEREWLVNLILFGNYGRLRDATLMELGATVRGRTLQMACVYGNLTARLRQRLAADAQLDVIDILPIQLTNLGRKLPPDERIALVQGDPSSLECPDASYDQVLLFFLLHEQPEGVRRGTLAEAMRVVKPGGEIVIVDYHRPSLLHPLRLLLSGVFRQLEPYARELWEREVEDFLPSRVRPVSISKQVYCSGLYQKLALIR